MFRHRGFLEALPQGMCVCAKLLQSCPTLCDLMDRSPPGSSVHGILHIRMLGWAAISSSRGSSWRRGQSSSLCLLHWQADSLLLAPPRKPCLLDFLLIIKPKSIEKLDSICSVQFLTKVSILFQKCFSYCTFVLTEHNIFWCRHICKNYCFLIYLTFN